MIKMLLSLPKIPPVRVHIIILFTAIRTMQGNTQSTTMLMAGSGSASSLVRSMKNARDDPQASENTDTMTPTFIDRGNLPDKLVQTNLFIGEVYRIVVPKPFGCHLIQHSDLLLFGNKIRRDTKYKRSQKHQTTRPNLHLRLIQGALF